MQNSTSEISYRTEVKAVKRLLTVLQPLAVTQRFGQAESLAKNEGVRLKWRRYHSFPPVTAPLADGITPTGMAVRYTDIPAIVQQYGAIIPLTDVIADTHEDPVLQKMTDLAGENAADTVEVVTISKLKAGTNVQYVGGVAGRTTVNGPITLGEVRKAVRTLDRAKAKPITRIISASPKYGTTAVLPAFIAFGHTDLDPEIRACTGFRPYSEYGNPNEMMPGEIGRIERVRFILTQNFTPFEAIGASGTTYLSGGEKVANATACDVYPIIIFGRDAYGIVRLQGMDAAKIYVLNPGVARGGDGLAQRGSVGWKIWYTATILNQAYLVRLEVAVRAEPSAS